MGRKPPITSPAWRWAVREVYLEPNDADRSDRLIEIQLELPQDTRTSIRSPLARSPDSRHDLCRPSNSATPWAASGLLTAPASSAFSGLWISLGSWASSSSDVRRLPSTACPAPDQVGSRAHYRATARLRGECSWHMESPRCPQSRLLRSAFVPSFDGFTSWTVIDAGSCDAAAILVDGIVDRVHDIGQRLRRRSRAACAPALAAATGLPVSANVVGRHVDGLHDAEQPFLESLERPRRYDLDRLHRNHLDQSKRVQ